MFSAIVAALGPLTKLPELARGETWRAAQQARAGASLARAEARISFQRLLARMDDLQRVDPSALSCAPSFLFRGLKELALRFRRRS